MDTSCISAGKLIKSSLCLISNHFTPLRKTEAMFFNLAGFTIFSSQLQRTEQTLTLKSDYFPSEVPYEILLTSGAFFQHGAPCWCTSKWEIANNLTNASLVPQQPGHHFSPKLIQTQTAQEATIANTTFANNKGSSNWTKQQCIGLVFFPLFLTQPVKIYTQCGNI